MEYTFSFHNSGSSFCSKVGLRFIVPGLHFIVRYRSSLHCSGSSFCSKVGLRFIVPGLRS